MTRPAHHTIAAASTCLALSVLATACKDERDDGSQREPTLAFDNTVSGDELGAPLDSLRSLAEDARSKASPGEGTRDTVTPTTDVGKPQTPVSALVADGSAASEPESCFDEARVWARLATAGGSSAGTSGLALTEGTDCSTALASLGAFHGKALSQVLAGVDTFKQGGSGCGFSRTALPVDPKHAAAGFEIRPVEPRQGMDYTRRLLAGANETQTILSDSLSLHCDAGVAGCRDTALSFTKTMEARADRDQHGLVVASTVDLTAVGPDAVPTSLHIQATTTVAGLGNGGDMRLDEASTLALTGSPAGDTSLALSAALEETTATALHVSGSVAVNGADQPFDVTLERRDGVCRVRTTPVEESEGGAGQGGNDDGGSGNDDGNGTIDGQTLPPEQSIGAADLPGTWERSCQTGIMSEASVETLAFTAAGLLVDTAVAYSDSVCFPGNETLRIQRKAKWSLGHDQVDGSTPLDLVNTELVISPLTDDAASNLNQMRACNITDWAKDAPRTFAAGQCWFVSGTSTLLSSNGLRHGAEFTTARWDIPNLAMEIALPTDVSNAPAGRASQNWLRFVRQ
jgi:hypothetical protein